MRIKLDENLPTVLVGILAETGQYVDTAPNEGLAARPDPEVWQAAQDAARGDEITADGTGKPIAAAPTATSQSSGAPAT